MRGEAGLAIDHGHAAEPQHQRLPDPAEGGDVDPAGGRRSVLEVEVQADGPLQVTLAMASSPSRAATSACIGGLRELSWTVSGS